MESVNSSNQNPVASFTTTASDLTVSFDASAATDSDGDILFYDWSFGDGTIGSEEEDSNIEHTYASAGTYQVKLRVTDNEGGTHILTKSVVVTDSIVNFSKLFNKQENLLVTPNKYAHEAENNRRRAMELLRKKRGCERVDGIQFCYVGPHNQRHTKRPKIMKLLALFAIIWGHSLRNFSTAPGYQAPLLMRGKIL